MTQHSSFSTHHWDFVWGTQYIDEAVCMDVDTDTSGEGYGDCTDAGSKRYFYCQDANWNVIALREGSTITERYEYDPYGECRVLKGYTSAENQEDLTVTGDSLAGNPIRYAGYFFDNETQRYHVRHRYLDPRLGRWQQEDPLGQVESLNPYHYVQCRPLALTDPLGLWEKDLHLGRTIEWAKAVGYTENGCAEIIGKACNDVDWSFGNTAALPFKGDMSYHFDYDKNGLWPVAGARQKHVDEHLTKARALAQYAQWPKTKAALEQIGTALHPLQDMDSHQQGHSAASPMEHAPRFYCAIVFLDPNGEREPWCKEQRQTNPNWKDAHRPDHQYLWPVDVAKTEQATKAVLKAFLQYEAIRCRCTSGLK